MGAQRVLMVNSDVADSISTDSYGPNIGTIALLSQALNAQVILGEAQESVLMNG